MMGCKGSPGGAASRNAVLLPTVGWDGQKLTRFEQDGEPGEPVFVPHTELDTDTLRRVVESFVLREGTDYGEREVSLEQKLSHVVRQLERGEAQIVFDPNTQSIDILVRRPGLRRT
jgi:uncharacterized protein YheU (UPF0270 family)